MLRILAGIFMCVGLAVANVPVVQAHSWAQTAHASKVPVTKFSANWAITFTGHGQNHAGREDLHLCSFSIANKGQLLNDVSVELYRPMANKQEHVQVMIGGPVHKSIMRPGQTITLQNFPVINTVEYVEFVITWKLDGRKYKHSLFFKQDELNEQRSRKPPDNKENASRGKRASSVDSFEKGVKHFK